MHAVVPVAAANEGVQARKGQVRINSFPKYTYYPAFQVPAFIASIIPFMAPPIVTVWRLITS